MNVSRDCGGGVSPSVVDFVKDLSWERGDVPLKREAVMSGRSLIGSSLLVAVGLLIGRSSGLLRELVLADVLGLTRAADLAMFALSIPDLLTGLLIGGAISAVLIPEYHALEKLGAARAANRLIGQSLLGIGLASLGLCVALFLGERWWIGAIAPGFAGADYDSAVLLSRIALIGFPLSALTAVTSAVLQIRQRLAMVSAGTMIFNGTIIVAVLTCLVPERIDVVGWAVVAAAFLRLASQIAVGIQTRAFAGAFVGVWTLSFLTRDLVSRYLQALAAIGLSICTPVIARAFASAEPGQMAAVTYALKLIEVPTGLCGAVLSMVVFPMLSRELSDKRGVDAQRLISRTTGLLMLLTVPATVGFLAAGRPIVSLLFERGRIGGNEVRLIADLSRIAMLSVPAVVVSTLAVSAFHARRDTRFPFVLGLLMTGLQLLVTPWFLSAWGTRGLMVTVVAIGWAQCLCLGCGLAIRHRIFLVSRWPPNPEKVLTEAVEIDGLFARKTAVR